MPNFALPTTTCREPGPSCPRDCRDSPASICRKTLNPIWNEDFRIEVSDDANLQNEPLEIRVLDYDAISTNNAVGSVTIDLNPLLVSWDVATVETTTTPAVIATVPNSANGTDMGDQAMNFPATPSNQPNPGTTRVLARTQTQPLRPSNAKQQHEQYDRRCAKYGPAN
jgi:hypothetical protein